MCAQAKNDDDLSIQNMTSTITIVHDVGLETKGSGNNHCKCSKSRACIRLNFF